MKTKVEVLGYEIEIEEVDGQVVVKANLNGEVVEEFTLEVEENEEQGQAQGQAQTQFQAQTQEEEEDDFENELEDEGQLESFQSFLNRTSKKRK